MKRFVRAIVLCITVQLSGWSSMNADEFNYDEARVPAFELPPLLKTTDGHVVATSSDWINVRRPQILHQFEEHVFGTLPPAVSKLRTRVRSSVSDAVHGKALRREVTVFFSEDDKGPQMDLLIYTPVAAKGPVPAFLGLNFNGNHSIETDSRLHITESWVRNSKEYGIDNNRATESSRGSEASRWSVEKIIDRGYGLITIYYGDIDPDFDDGFKNGIHQLFPGSDQRTPDSGGSISAWAWGLSRALDVLETDSRIDASHVAVFGHSRLGKTSLWAGAMDQRFAMVISNNSGCGGAALSRRKFGETVARINTSFPHWFCLNHRLYNGREEHLPVDNHMLIALAAPRPVYVASAEEDRWADPRGEFLSAYYAGEVYQLFGKEGLTSDTMPGVNQPVMSSVGYHIRTGAHDVTEYDWEQYLNFADMHLRK
ncbi:MAG: acetylxylan esterase [Planctomyces sp.]|nr:acetylxylan esterase [Planctomyces sp.]